MESVRQKLNKQFIRVQGEQRIETLVETIERLELFVSHLLSRDEGFDLFCFRLQEQLTALEARIKVLEDKLDD